MCTMMDLANTTETIHWKVRFWSSYPKRPMKIAENEIKSIERQSKIYKARSVELEDLKVHIPELKLQAKEDPSKEKKWLPTNNKKQNMFEPSY